MTRWKKCFAWTLVAAAFAASGLSACQSLDQQPQDADGLLPASCPSSEQMVSAQDSDYGRALIGSIYKHIMYPVLAQQAGQMGHVDVCVHVQGGDIPQAAIEHSSGFPLLDGVSLYAVGMVTETGLLDRVPKSLGNGANDLWLSVPIDFRPADSGASPPAAAMPAKPEPKPRVLPASYLKSGSGKHFVKGLKGALAATGALPGIYLRPGDDYKAVVRLVVSRQGQITAASIVRSSGGPFFDGVMLMDAGLLALKEQKFPVPDDVKDDFVQLDFAARLFSGP